MKLDGGHHAETVAVPYDVEQLRGDFPALHQEIYGRPLVYLDNAATTHKPQQVIDAVVEFYSRDNSNVHRGVHALSQRATDRYEEARHTVARFLNAESQSEVVFVRGCTEGINLIANSLVNSGRLSAGDEILVTGIEHHANIVPWQMAAARTGAVLRHVPMQPDGSIRAEDVELMLSDKTKVFGCIHISNALGTVNDVKTFCALARSKGALTVVDGAQAVPHAAVDVQTLGADFYVFSGHKVYAPTGIGVVWCRADLLRSLEPWQGGGDMILSVSFEKTVYNDIPNKFEAGTPNIAGAIGLAAALRYVQAVGLEAIARHEAALLEYATAKISSIDGVKLIGTAPDKAAVVSFLISGVHPHDVGTMLDRAGVAIRAGHHCAQPVMKSFGVAATARASFALYSTYAEIDALCAAVEQTRDFFA